MNIKHGYRLDPIKFGAFANEYDFEKTPLPEILKAAKDELSFPLDYSDAEIIETLERASDLIYGIMPKWNKKAHKKHPKITKERLLCGPFHFNSLILNKILTVEEYGALVDKYVAYKTEHANDSILKARSLIKGHKNRPPAAKNIQAYKDHIDGGKMDIDSFIQATGVKHRSMAVIHIGRIFVYLSKLAKLNENGATA